MHLLLRPIDNLLNNITMYRLVTYGLGIILILAAIFGYTGVLAISGTGVIVSTAVLAVSCYISNKLLARLFGVATNNESYLISSLILACILSPTTSVKNLQYMALAGIVAMASKYVFAFRRAHVFNPAVVAAVTLSLSGLLSVSWWIGNPTMIIPVTILGLLVIRKIRRFQLLFVFLASSILMTILVSIVSGQDAAVLLKNAVLSGPLIFFATIMLSEPSTMPSRHYYLLLFGLLVGTLYSAQLRYGFFSTSPHMVLAVGNIFAYVVSSKTKLTLYLKEKIRINDQVYDYVFSAPYRLTFIPGQYMEWTLPHKHVDGRGNRRTFSIASSPTEKDIHLGVKFYKPSSSFKRALYDMRPGDTIAAGQVGGNFVLKGRNEKLVFIAGGIGITPFRSMLKNLSDTKQRRDIVLFYIAGKPDEFAYKDVLRDALALGIRIVPVLGSAEKVQNWRGYTGTLTPEIITKEVPDYRHRTFYISGPNGLVEAYKHILRSQGVNPRHMVSDYFAGY